MTILITGQTDETEKRSLESLHPEGNVNRIYGNHAITADEFRLKTGDISIMVGLKEKSTNVSRLYILGTINLCTKSQSKQVIRSHDIQQPIDQKT